MPYDVLRKCVFRFLKYMGGLKTFLHNDDKNIFFSTLSSWTQYSFSYSDSDEDSKGGNTCNSWVEGVHE